MFISFDDAVAKLSEQYHTEQGDECLYVHVGDGEYGIGVVTEDRERTPLCIVGVDEEQVKKLRDELIKVEEIQTVVVKSAQAFKKAKKEFSMALWI